MFEWIRKKIPTISLQNSASDRVITSINDLTPEEKLTIEEQAELGTAPKDIAGMLGIEARWIYYYRRHRIDNGQYAKENNKDRTELQELKEKLEEERLKHELQILKETNALKLESLKVDIETKKVKLKQQIDDLNSENDYDEDEQDSDTPDALIMQLLGQVLNAKNATSPNSVEAPVVAPIQTPGKKVEDDEISDTQLKEFVAQIPKPALSKAKVMKDSELRNYITTNYNVSEKIAEKAVIMIKEA